MRRESYLGTRCDLCGDDTAAFKETAEMICVDGSGVPLFIGHVTPWGRTNWCRRPPKKDPPALSLVLTKTLGCGWRRGWRVGGGPSGGSEEQVSHRILGWDELEGAIAIRLQRDMTHSFSRTHTHISTHSLWGTLVPVAGLLLDKSDPHSQPCVRLPFIPQPQ